MASQLYYEEHGFEDDRPCRYWERGSRGTYYEPDEHAGCGDPARCSEHWKQVKNPEVECPKCHKTAKMNGLNGLPAYIFDEVKECIIAHPSALCDECEMDSEDE